MIKKFSDIVKSRITTVEVNWGVVKFNELSKCQTCDFYILSRGSNLLYIGKAFHTDVKTEVPQSIDRHRFDKRGLSIQVGQINLEKSSISKRTESIVNDIEKLLIYCHNDKPLVNTHHMDKYTGRKNMTVKNIYSPLLRRCIRDAEGRQYKSC